MYVVLCVAIDTKLDINELNYEVCYKPITCVTLPVVKEYLTSMK
jgi:hypothetical protein